MIIAINGSIEDIDGRMDNSQINRKEDIITTNSTNIEDMNSTIITIIGDIDVTINAIILIIITL